MTREREPRTFLCFLIEQMEGVDETRRRRSLKERLGLRGIGCCGANWGFGAATVRDDDEEEDEEESQRQQVVPDVGAAPLQRNSDPGCTDPVPRGSGMNLAAALAAERHFRASSEPEQPNEMAARAAGLNSMGTGTAPGTPLRVSLLRLLEETTESGGGTEATQKERGSGTVGGDSVCCVCMVRKKGAAFIPCGHTFCRVCSRELWLNRGSCPLCNRSILEILDIF